MQISSPSASSAGGLSRLAAQERAVLAAEVLEDGPAALDHDRARGGATRARGRSRRGRPRPGRARSRPRAAGSGARPRRGGTRAGRPGGAAFGDHVARRRRSRSGGPCAGGGAPSRRRRARTGPRRPAGRGWSRRRRCPARAARGSPASRRPAAAPRAAARGTGAPWGERLRDAVAPELSRLRCRARTRRIAARTAEPPGKSDFPKNSRMTLTACGAIMHRNSSRAKGAWTRRSFGSAGAFGTRTEGGMKKLLLAAGLAGVRSAMGGDALACGDKLVIVGRGMRPKRARAACPASILVYADPKGSMPAALGEGAPAEEPRAAPGTGSAASGPRRSSTKRPRHRQLRPRLRRLQGRAAGRGRGQGARRSPRSCPPCTTPRTPSWPPRESQFQCVIKSPGSGRTTWPWSTRRWRSGPRNARPRRSSTGGGRHARVKGRVSSDRSFCGARARCAGTASAQAWLPPEGGGVALASAGRRTCADHHIDYQGARRPGRHDLEQRRRGPELRRHRPPRRARERPLRGLEVRAAPSHTLRPGDPNLDDGAWHSTFQDLLAEVRFRATPALLAVTPCRRGRRPHPLLRVLRPRRGRPQPRRGPGRDHRGTPARPPPAERLRPGAVHVRDAREGARHLAQPEPGRLRRGLPPPAGPHGRVLGAWQKTHGGWRVPIDFPPDTSPEFQVHDQLVEAPSTSAWGAACPTRSPARST